MAGVDCQSRHRTFFSSTDILWVSKVGAYDSVLIFCICRHICHKCCLFVNLVYSFSRKIKFFKHYFCILCQFPIFISHIYSSFLTQLKNDPKSRKNYQNQVLVFLNVLFESLIIFTRKKRTNNKWIQYMIFQIVEYIK